MYKQKTLKIIHQLPNKKSPMKNLIFFATLVCSMLAFQTVTAQEPVATLEHNGTSKVFYGLSAFADAYNASLNGDRIYLSAGYFDPPTSIEKGVKITGAGHFPIEGKQTQITKALTISKGADSLRLEGLYISGALTYDYLSSINYIKVIRCGFTQANFNSTTTASKDYCSFEECFISGAIYFGSAYGNGRGNNFLLRNSIVQGAVNYIPDNALIEGNIFLFNATNVYSSTFLDSNHSIIQNNVFLGNKYLFYNGAANTINKNLFVSSDPEEVNKTANYTGIAQSDIFINQTGNLISYLQDYHLKKSGTYIGTNGTQVGLYGGLSFKENGVPSNPSIVSKTVATKTEPDGNLQINISVKAQDN